MSEERETPEELIAELKCIIRRINTLNGSKEFYYQSAINDIINWFEGHSVSIKNNKLNNSKGFLIILKGMLENHEVFAQFGEFTELTYKDGRITSAKGDI